MKRINVGVVCAAATVALAAHVLLAQVQKSAAKDLAALIQAGETKQALEQIQAGADVNRAQPDGTTPLLWAVSRLEYDVAQALIARKADANAVNQFGAMPLTEAARKSDVRLVKMLLDAGAKVDSANPDGETALMMAITGGNVEAVELLIKAGANVNTAEKFHNQTPLMYAAASRNGAPIVKLLLAKDADVRARALYSDWPSQVTSEPRTQYRSVGGLTALLYAARSGCYECVQDLLAAGADINLPTPEGVTPLMIALDNEHNDVAKLLIEKGANLNVWDWWGRTALWVAVDRKAAPGGGGRAGGGGRGGRGGGPGAGFPRGGGAPGSERPAVSSMEIISTLLNAGVDANPEMNFHRPNAPARGRFADNQISTGTTPLFRGVQNNDVEVIKALLDKGADPNINTMGYSAFHLAAGAGPSGRGGAAGAAPNMQILDLMVQHSADVNAKVSSTKLYSFDVSRENLGNKDAFRKDGSTALHEAARAGRTDLVKFLLEHGADPNVLDADGKKPIDLIGVPRVARGGNAPAAATQQAKGNPGGPAPGPGRGAPGRGGANPAALSEIRVLLETASAKR